MPANAPVTLPVAEPTFALELLLVHVPPPPSVSVIVDPTQTEDGPEIDDGSGSTVIVAVVTHPVPSV